MRWVEPTLLHWLPRKWPLFFFKVSSHQLAQCVGGGSSGSSWLLCGTSVRGDICMSWAHTKREPDICTVRCVVQVSGETSARGGACLLVCSVYSVGKKKNFQRGGETSRLGFALFRAMWFALVRLQENNLANKQVDPHPAVGFMLCRWRIVQLKKGLTISFKSLQKGF